MTWCHSSIQQVAWTLTRCSDSSDGSDVQSEGVNLFPSFRTSACEQCGSLHPGINKVSPCIMATFLETPKKEAFHLKEGTSYRPYIFQNQIETNLHNLWKTWVLSTPSIISKCKLLFLPYSFEHAHMPASVELIILSLDSGITEGSFFVPLRDSVLLHKTTAQINATF